METGAFRTAKTRTICKNRISGSSSNRSFDMSFKTFFFFVSRKSGAFGVSVDALLIFCGHGFIVLNE